MAIDYLRESEKYRPETIKTLLVGEAPPPSEGSYFYVPRAMSNNLPIRIDRSLPATIFFHYFQTRPVTKDEYIDLLLKLQQKGVFLIDIFDEPLRIRGKNGIIKENLDRIIDQIPKLRNKITSRNISIKDRDTIFLLPRSHYLKHLEREFPNATYVKWIDFRLSPEPF